jgi:NADH-quinone oxidoreductase subunit N
VTLDGLAGFGWERPYHAAAMWVFMLGFAGFPLTGGFIGKFWVFSAAWEAGWWWLVVIGVLATALSVFYYLRVVGVMYLRPGQDRLTTAPAGGSPPRDPALSLAVALGAFVTIASFFLAGPLLDLAGDAAEVLPFS